MLEHTLCALCGSEKYKPIFQKQSFQVVRCNGCDLVYVNPRVSAQDLSYTYTQEYYSEELLLKISSDPMTRKRAEERLDELERQVQIVQVQMAHKLQPVKPVQPVRLLDVGCGLGTFLQLASGRSWECIGLDPSIKGAEFVKSKLGIEVSCGYLNEIAFPSASFDCVTLYHVIEHEPNPKNLLNEVRRILKPKSGILAMETPNFNSLRRLILGSKWGYIHPKDHILYFSPHTLRRLLRESGFTQIFFGKPRHVKLEDNFMANVKHYLRKPITNVLVRLNLGIVLRLYARWE